MKIFGLRKMTLITLANLLIFTAYCMALYTVPASDKLYVFAATVIALAATNVVYLGANVYSKYFTMTQTQLDDPEKSTETKLKQ